jgi:hypothetical protein
VKAALITAIIVLLLAMTAFTGYIVINFGPDNVELSERIKTAGRLFAFSNSLTDKITKQDKALLFEINCKNRCHSVSAVEEHPRSSREWSLVVSKMLERSKINKRVADSIAEHLSDNYLSTVPTIMSDELMSFLKRNLWRIDLGSNDLYLDIIYIPKNQRGLLPYLGINDTSEYDLADDDTLFVVYINTHQSTLPPWELDKATTLAFNNKTISAKDWFVSYEDTQQHHREGLLVLPKLKTQTNKEPLTIMMTIKLDGMRKKEFSWILPVPEFKGSYENRLY